MEPCNGGSRYWVFTSSDREIVANLQTDSSEDDDEWHTKTKIGRDGQLEFDYSFDEDEVLKVNGKTWKQETSSDELIDWVQARKQKKNKFSSKALGFVEQKMHEILDGRPIRPVTLPSTIADSVEMAPIGLDWFPPLNLKKSLTMEIRDTRTGDLVTVKRVVGYREIFMKRQRISLFQEKAVEDFAKVYQEMRRQLMREDVLSVMNRVEESQDYYDTNMNPQLAIGDFDFSSSDVNSESCSIFIEEIPVGGGKPGKEKKRDNEKKGDNRDKKKKQDNGKDTKGKTSELEAKVANKGGHHHHHKKKKEEEVIYEQTSKEKMRELENAEKERQQKMKELAKEEKKRREREKIAKDQAEKVEQGQILLQNEILEKDEEWFKLSESDPEQATLKDLTDTLGKEKAEWMRVNISYESQMMIRQMRSFDWFLFLIGRQPFQAVPPARNATHKHMSFIVKPLYRQIPYILTSLVLWFITANLLISLFVVYSQEKVGITPYEELETTELNKYLNGFAIVVAQCIAVSVWSATLIYRDGEFICQYLTCQSQALTDMETSGMKGVKRFLRLNHFIVFFYIAFMVSCFLIEKEATEFIRGTSGILGLMIFRSYYPSLAYDNNIFWYVRLFGLIFQIYAQICFRSLMAMLQINAKILKHMAQMWNFKFGLHFSQFAMMGRGHLYRLKLTHSLVKIFKHHRYLYCLVKLYSSAFSTPILLYFLLQTSIALLVFCNLFFYVTKTDDGIESYLTAEGEKTLIKKPDRYQDFVFGSVLVLFQSLGDFIFTTRSIASAGDALMDGFEFVRRQGQIICAGSHERRLIQSLQWSFSQTNPALVNTMFPINPPTIFASVGAILMLYSLIIQIQSGASGNVVTVVQCLSHSGRNCAVILPTEEKATTTPPSTTIKTTRPPTIAITTFAPSDSRKFWFFEDCDHANLDKAEKPSNVLTTCNQLVNSSLLLDYPHRALSVTSIGIIQRKWTTDCSSIPPLQSSMDLSCTRDKWQDHLKNFYLPCYSNMLKKYIILQYALICPQFNCPFYPVRTLLFNRDCAENPYPIPELANKDGELKMSLNSSGLAGWTNWTHYWSCDRITAVDVINDRDDCGWISLPGLEFEIPSLVLLPFLFQGSPDQHFDVRRGTEVSDSDLAYYLSQRSYIYPVTRICFSNNLFRCQHKEVNKFCQFAKRGIEAGPSGTTQGYMYGSYCYDPSLIFEFELEKDAFQQHCRVGIAQDDMYTPEKPNIYHPQSEYEVALQNWNRPDFTYTKNPACALVNCPLHEYDPNDWPCLSRYKLQKDFDGFIEAMDFRMPCTHIDSGGIERTYLLMQIFEVDSTTGEINALELPRQSSSNCWVKPYELLTSPDFYDCWGKRVILDDCESINQPYFAGPEFRDERSWRQRVNITVKGPVIGGTHCTANQTSIRTCWNNPFAIDRCSDVKVTCKNDIYC